MKYYVCNHNVNAKRRVKLMTKRRIKLLILAHHNIEYNIKLTKLAYLCNIEYYKTVINSILTKN